MIFVTDSYWMAMFGHSRASSFCGDPSVDSSGFGDGDDLDMSEFGDFDVDLTGYDWDVRGGCLNGCSDPFHELGQVEYAYFFFCLNACSDPFHEVGQVEYA